MTIRQKYRIGLCVKALNVFVDHQNYTQYTRPLLGQILPISSRYYIPQSLRKASERKLRGIGLAVVSVEDDVDELHPAQRNFLGLDTMASRYYTDRLRAQSMDITVSITCIFAG